METKNETPEVHEVEVETVEVHGTDAPEEVEVHGTDAPEVEVHGTDAEE
jgi:hypothetical protein